MNQKTKQFQEEFNLLNKNNPLKVVSKRRYTFFKYTAILFIILLCLVIPTTIIAQGKISLEKGFIIKIQHDITQETLETITKYIEFTLNNLNNETG